MNVSDQLVDTLRNGVPVPSGTLRDDSLDEPFEYAAQRLYAWLLPETFAEYGEGSMDRDNFTVALGLTIPSTEEAAATTDRTTRLALGDAVEPIVDWVRANRSGPQWDDLQVRVLWPGFRGLDYRGVRLELSGYRFLS